ncbi:MAG: LL-diaminopimelate aminotransferase [Paludibacteraceae bacterium]|nr:LL-diaminopimelate aminotransferase [Paludibacteraceae bacterium]
MALANENYLKTPEIYGFDEIEKRINAYRILNPKSELINIGLGDVTLPLIPEVVKAMHLASDELSKTSTFKGYGPPKGYDFLISKIQKNYKTNGIAIDKDTIFVNDGAKSTIGNIGHVLGRDNIIAISDPVYPVYENATIMSGRAGDLNEKQQWSHIVYLHCSEKNNFIPDLPKERVDIIYLCNPNNPTGTAMNRSELKKWVDYAIENHSIIVYDGVYSEFITEPDIPRSIYEIKGAKKVVVEVRTYSKLAGFTGLRCGYAVFPNELTVYTQEGESIPLVKLWNRRNSYYTNGVSYIVQRAAEAIYSIEGERQIKEQISYYMTNAAMLREQLIALGHEVYGGVNAPYVWMKTPGNSSSWDYFNELLYLKKIIVTPGVLFGKNGEGYIRFSGFANREMMKLALEKFKT